jgi:hypothetical protein
MSYAQPSPPKTQTDFLLRVQTRVDGAFFGARQHGHADREMQADGFDIRLNSFNEDFYIRSIKVRGYDLDKEVDYQRLLKLEGVAVKGDLLLFTPGQQETLTYKFWNMAHKPIDGELAYTLCDSEDKVLRKGSIAATVAGGGRTGLPVPVDTTGLKYGVYSLNLSLVDKTTGKRLLQHESYLGVCSGTDALPKARDGEFLYGLDVALAHYNELGPRLTAGAAGFGPYFVPFGYLSIAISMGFTFMIFEGYEVVAQTGEEAKDPEKTVPRAMFLCIGVLYDRVHSREISAYGGVVNTMPKFAAFAVLFAMANCGLPGTAGFVGEWMVILGTVKVNFWIAAAAATTLIWGAAYTLWMVKRVYFGGVANDNVHALADLDRREFAMLAIVAAAVLAMGLYPKPFTDVMHASVTELLRHASVPKIAP